MMRSLANEVAIVSVCGSGEKGCVAKTVNNVYLRFCTPGMERSITSFRAKYMRPVTASAIASSCCRQQHPSRSDQQVFFCIMEIYTASSSAADAGGVDVVEDMVRTWWESTGKPLILTDRVTARQATFVDTKIFCVFFSFL